MSAFASSLSISALLLPLAGVPGNGAGPSTMPTPAPPGAFEIVTPVRSSEPLPRPVSSAPPRLPDPPVTIGMMTFAPAAPTAFHVRGAGSRRTGGGLSFLSFSGRGWYLPRPDRVGETWRFGGSISPGELAVDERINGFFWPLEAQVARGVRAPLGGSTYFHALLGLDGLVKMSGRTDDGAQRRRGYLHVPELSLAVSHGGRGSYVEIGPLGGLAAVGIDDVAFSRERGAGASVYGPRPYAGAQASFIERHWLVSAAAHHTWLGATGERDQRAVGLVCRHAITPRHRIAFGGCLQGDVTRARVSGSAELISYEITWRLGVLYLST